MEFHFEFLPLGTSWNHLEPGFEIWWNFPGSDQLHLEENQIFQVEIDSSSSRTQISQLEVDSSSSKTPISWLEVDSNSRKIKIYLESHKMLISQVQARSINYICNKNLIFIVLVDFFNPAVFIELFFSSRILKITFSFCI